MESVLGPRKKIGLVAHDNKKTDLIEWARYNLRLLEAHDLVATGTTGTLLADEQKGEVFFVLRTVISSFARKPNGKEIKS